MGIAIGADAAAGSKGIDLEAFLQLGQRMDDMHATMKRGKPKPIRKPAAGSVVVPVAFTQPVLMVCSTYPAAGREWNILAVGVFATDPHTLVANVVADIYAGTNPDPQNPVFTDVIASGLAVASVTSFSKEVHWASSGNQVFALLSGTGLVAGQNYSMVVKVAEYGVFEVETRHVP